MKKRDLTSSLVLVVPLLLSGCQYWNTVFGPGKDEAKEVVTALVNVFADTAASADIAYDSNQNTFSYSSGGAFIYNVNLSSGMVQMYLNNYEPPGADYKLSGILGAGTSRVVLDGSVGSAPTSGTLYLSRIGNTSYNYNINVKLQGSLVNGRMVAEGAEFTGGTNDYGVEEFGLLDTAVKNFNLMLDKRDAAMVP